MLIPIRPDSLARQTLSGPEEVAKFLEDTYADKWVLHHLEYGDGGRVILNLYCVCDDQDTVNRYMEEKFRISTVQDYLKSGLVREKVPSSEAVECEGVMDGVMDSAMDSLSMPLKIFDDGFHSEPE